MPAHPRPERGATDVELEVDRLVGAARVVSTREEQPLVELSRVEQRSHPEIIAWPSFHGVERWAIRVARCRSGPRSFV
jgi:hypothetical protein